MPTMLDERPQRRGPVLFGRALVEQQKAEQAAREKARDDARLEAAQIAAERHARAQDDIARERLRLEQQKASLETELKLREIQKERMQLDAFAKAQREIGKLKPDDPELSARIAEIQAQNNILFDGKSPFASALGDQVSDLFSRRKAVESAAETKAKAEAGRAAAQAAGMQPSSFTDPLTGVTSKAPAPSTEGKDTHALQKLYMDDYHAIERERAGLPFDPKTQKEKVDPSVVKMLDERRTKALENLRSVGVNLEADKAIAQAPLATTPAAEPAAAPLDREALAKAALDDPLATDAHKKAARKILGYQDEQ